MISMARFRNSSSAQRPKHAQQQSFSDYQPASTPGDSRLSEQPLRSFGPNPPFAFDFRLENSDVRHLGAVKPAEQSTPRRAEPSVDFSLTGFSEPTPTGFSEPTPHTSTYAYEPTPLTIPSQGNPSNHSPSAYLPSATSTIATQSFPDFPQSSNSRSLSPLEHTGWTDQSSASLSLSPQDGAPDLGFDTRLAPMPFSMNLESSESSLQLPLSPEAAPLPTDSRSDGSNRHGSPDSGSSDFASDIPRSKIGPNGLAEDQPPTAQGKMRTRVYVACLQCRSRKIRCDGAKPKCQKCSRRSSECQYDAAPKRRGPDKRPGARQRTSKKAKAAKEEAARKGEISQGEPWESVLPEYGNERATEYDDGNEGSRKRRKPSGPTPTSLFLVADAEETGRRRGGSAGTTSSVEGQAPVTPGDARAGLMTFSDLGETSHSRKTDPGLLAGLGSRTHVQPTSHDRIPFFGLELGDGRLTHPPAIAHHRHHAHYVQPAPASVPVDLGLDYFPQAHITAVDEEDQEDHQLQRHKRKYDVCVDGAGIGSEPSLDFSRKTWWDSLLAMYAPGMDRAMTSRQVHTDLQFLFKCSNYFFSFFNVPLFFSVFCNPVERDKMQPSLVLAGLAVSTFLRSSEIDRGNSGRLRALWLRDAAQSALEASFNAQWIEPTLAQAAWLLAFFEMCAHPYHSTERSNSSMVMLDSIVRSLALTRIDASDPSTSVFSPRAVPIVPATSAARISRQGGCSCLALSLGQNSRSSHTHTPLWAATPAWHPDLTVAEIRKEESRRLCWSTLQLAAGHTAHAAAFSAAPLDFYCIQPANYSLLFPGEALAQSPSFDASHPPKETVWALYSRAMLLWNSCLRMRGDDVSDNDKAVFAVSAWLESTAIEEALDAHTCGCDQAFLFQGREYLFITRMCISYEFRRFIPHPESEVSGLFNRKKAEAWLLHQAAVAKRIMHGLHTVTGHKNNVLAQRPFFVWWFMSQVARSLLLWSCDHSLLIALEVCQAFFPPIDYLSCLWPCPAQRSRYLSLHARLAQACRAAGVPPPPPPNFDILAPGSPPMAVV